MNTDLVKMPAINWNKVLDPLDLEIWQRLTANFWLPEKIPLSNDLPSWHTLSKAEQLRLIRVFAGLTLLDTLQSTWGAPSMIEDSRTDHEAAVLTNIAFMESVHAKSYSYIFSTLCTSEQIEEAFDWAYHCTYLQKQATVIRTAYERRSNLHKKIASTLLEGYLFYSGFYLPLYYAARSKLPNTADIIRLIIRDEAIHGYYIGYKFQRGLACLDADSERHIMGSAYMMLHELADLQLSYINELYDENMRDDVLAFSKYNANKALMNLSLQPAYPQHECQFDESVMASLAPQSNENHDFFSGSGSTYVIGKSDEIQDEDWLF